MVNRRAIALASLTLVFGGCSGPRPYRLTKPAETISLKGANRAYDALTAETRPTIRVKDLLPQPVAAAQEQAVLDKQFNALTTDEARTLASEVYPVVVDGRQLKPSEKTTGETLLVGTRRFDISGRQVDASDNAVALGAVVGEPHTKPVAFDIGAGIGVMTNTSSGPNNDVMAFFACAKAYPTGGWYSVAEVGDGEKKSHEYLRVPGTDFLDRLSLNVGISNSVGSDTIQDPALFVGVGIDFAPQLGLVAGVAWFELDDSLAGSNNNASFFIGTTLSLGAVADLLSLKAKGFSTAQ